MPTQSPPATTDLTGNCWADTSRHALALAEALQALAPGQPPETQAACATYSSLVDEIARWARAEGAMASPGPQESALTRKQAQDFGRLLRDKRNQAGLSRVQLAQLAKLSDATIKFAETARQPPSRATLLRLVAVAELGLSWADTPGYAAGAVPADPKAPPSAGLAAEFSRFDSRLTLPFVNRHPQGTTLSQIRQGHGTPPSPGSWDHRRGGKTRIRQGHGTPRSPGSWDRVQPKA